jgi:hypothetical protein
LHRDILDRDILDRGLVAATSRDPYLYQQRNQLAKLPTAAAPAVDIATSPDLRAAIFAIRWPE